MSEGGNSYLEPSRPVHRKDKQSTDQETPNILPAGPSWAIHSRVHKLKKTMPKITEADRAGGLKEQLHVAWV